MGAARTALLDDVTPTGSTILTSDDASDEGDDYPGGKPIPNIRSLEKPSLPAIPDEQDRKRFVGCLAAVLSSMYDYESYELQSDKNSTKSINENEVSGFFDFYESSDEESIDGSSSLKEKRNSANNAKESNVSMLSSTPSIDTTDTTNNFYSRTCQSFESVGSSRQYNGRVVFF